MFNKKKSKKEGSKDLNTNMAKKFLSEMIYWIKKSSVFKGNGTDIVDTANTSDSIKIKIETPVIQSGFLEFGLTAKKD